MMEHQAGFEHVHTFPEGECIVSMLQHNGRIFVATNQDVYEVTGAGTELVRMRFRVVEAV